MQKELLKQLPDKYEGKQMKEMETKMDSKLNQLDSGLTIKLLNCLEDNEDVNKVYTNFDYS